MALPSSGAISFSNINAELSAATNAVRSLNDSAVRTLFSVATGAISMSNGYGKSSVWKATINTNQKEMNLATWARANGWDGSSAAEITVASGVYIWSDNTATPALTTGSFPGGLTIINNGYIIGRGGNGGMGMAGSAGGNAISISQSCSITNNSYIAGGGGGGSGSYYSAGGGGGAGGGVGGGNAGSAALGQAGANGTATALCSGYNTTGGNGGRILPGAGGSGALGAGNGGGAGGGGGGDGYGNSYGGAGGSGGAAAPSAASCSYSAGGGGGWGAAGGATYCSTGGWNFPAAAGGKAVALNGFTVSWISTGTLFGNVA